MKKIVSLILVLALAIGACMALTACNEGNTGSTGGNQEKNSYTVGICQLMEHESLDKATQGFTDAVTAQMEAAGKTVTFAKEMRRPVFLK